jgi:hypothetical protein
MIYDTQSIRWRELRRPDYTVVPMDSFSTLFTSVCRSHHGVHVRQHADGSRGVFTTADIQSGEVLLVEHVMAGTPWDIHRAVMSSKSFCANLCPRLPSDWESAPPSASIFEKFDRNCFNTDAQNDKGDPLYALCCAISMINHSDRANALTRHFWWNMENTDIQYYFMFVVAFSPIKAGEEVFITYNAEPRAGTPSFVGRTPVDHLKRSVLVALAVQDEIQAEASHWARTPEHTEMLARQLALVRYGYYYNEYADAVLVCPIAPKGEESNPLFQNLSITIVPAIVRSKLPSLLGCNTEEEAQRLLAAVEQPLKCGAA